MVSNRIKIIHYKRIWKVKERSQIKAKMYNENWVVLLLQKPGGRFCKDLKHLFVYLFPMATPNSFTK